jgi:WD40 repeat protein
MNSTCSSKDTLNEKIKELEDKINKCEYALTYCKLKNSDSPIIITGSADQTIKLWDIEKAQCIKTLIGHSHSIDTLKLLQNGHLISGSRDKTIRIWNLSTGQCTQILEGHKDSIYSCQLTQNAQYLITCSLDESIKVWQLESGECVKTIKESFCVFSILLIDKDEKLISGLENGHIKIWNFGLDFNSVDVQHPHIMFGHVQIVRALQLLYKGFLLSGSDDRSIKLWDLDACVCVRTFEGHAEGVNDLKLMKNGNLASCSHDRTIKIWDLGENSCLNTLCGHESTINSINVMSNGNLVSCSKDKHIKMWDITTKLCVSTFSGHEDSVLCAELMNSIL